MVKSNVLLDKIKASRKIVISTHRNPDGDAIGSSLALQKVFLKMGIDTSIVMPSSAPDFLLWLNGCDEIVIYDENPVLSADLVEEADLVFCLDFNQLERIDKLGEVIRNSDGIKILIDHHLNPSDFAAFIFSSVQVSSTCELLYSWLRTHELETYIDVDVATSLYVGILTDTGSYKFGTSPELFKIAADLLELGIDDVEIQNRLFNSSSEKRLRLFGHCLTNRMEILEEYATGLIWLTKEDYEQFSIERGDTEGIVNTLLQIKNVVMGIFIHEQPTVVKLSLRSKGDFSVEEIARKYFKGGGHRNASGGISFLSLSQTLEKIKEILPRYKNKLSQYNN
jgi:phosphoesterase RecJ-like protein